MNRLRYLAVFAAIVLLVAPLSAQTMKVHYGDDVLRLTMDQLDSLSFSEDSFVAPAQIELDVTSEGVDGGGAMWTIEVAATLTDDNGNPVADGIPVHFSLAGEIGHIVDGYTGNMPMSGNPTPGVAYSTLRYHSQYTNETVTANAACYVSGGTIEEEYMLHLPIQEATGSLIMSPSNFHYDQHVPNPGYSQILMQVYVLDGHNHPIANQQVHFSPQFGRVYDSEVLVPQNPQDPFANTNEDGFAERWLLITQSEAFPDPTAPINTCTVSVEMVGIEGANIEPFTIFLYQGGGFSVEASEGDDQ
ncbi:Ig-like domain-containing protein [bacterium]|nr:Ig-like domain-containing protein [bacterium]